MWSIQARAIRITILVFSLLFLFFDGCPENSLQFGNFRVSKLTSERCYFSVKFNQYNYGGVHHNGTSRLTIHITNGR